MVEQNIKRKRRLIRQIRQDIIIKLSAFTAALFITFTCIFGVCPAPTNDMFPAVREGDVLIYYRLGSPMVSDIVLYKTGETENIARVQAEGGVTIDKTEGGLLTIGGNLQPVQKRSGLYYKTYIREEGALEYPSIVPEGAYLVLGDDRTHAKDSREHGYVSKKALKGKVFTIIRRRPL